MKRHKHSLSHYVLSTFDMGELIPVGNFEVLPGDSIRMATSALVRVSPLLAPVMHPVQVRIHHWFCPYRILWSSWEDFITGGDDGVGPAFPVINANTNGAAGKIMHYCGLPTTSEGTVNVSDMPVRAYNTIWNENYRDEDLVTAVSPTANGDILRVSWEKDYFTTARPWSQKGPAVTLPLGTSAPVISDGNPIGWRDQAGTLKQIQLTNAASTVALATNAGASGLARAASAAAQSGYVADLSTATAAAVNDLRRAMALQRYQEARAQYGHRYTEYLRYLGVRSSDARLNRPEYLGGGKATISFSEVLRTATTAADTSPVGDMSGHGIAGVRSRSFVRFFEEHGIVMTLASVRPRAMYTNGIKREWNRTTKEDFWQKELELIGQQPVLNKEVYSPHVTPGGTFGWQDRYAEYRHAPSYVCGDFRTTLNDWHMARIFGAAPSLNSAFIQCDPGVRSFADQTAADKLWCMFSHSIQARRMVTKKTIGRIM